MKSIACMLLWLSVLGMHPLRGEQVEREQTFGTIHLVELHESETVTPLFAVTGIEITADAVLIPITPRDPAQVAARIATGRLTAEWSDASGASTPVPLQFWRKCLCQGRWVSSGFDVLRSCADLCGTAPEGEEFFFRVMAPWPPGADLAIGFEPDSLWLFEER